MAYGTEHQREVGILLNTMRILPNTNKPIRSLREFRRYCLGGCRYSRSGSNGGRPILGRSLFSLLPACSVTCAEAKGKA